MQQEEDLVVGQVHTVRGADKQRVQRHSPHKQKNLRAPEAFMARTLGKVRLVVGLHVLNGSALCSSLVAAHS